VKPVQHQQPQAPGAPEVSLRKDESAQDYDLMPKKGRLKVAVAFLAILQLLFSTPSLFLSSVNML
jgi:hypothetical protein